MEWYLLYLLGKFEYWGESGILDDVLVSIEEMWRCCLVSIGWYWVVLVSIGKYWIEYVSIYGLSIGKYTVIECSMTWM